MNPFRQIFTSKVSFIPIVFVVMAAGFGVGVWIHIDNRNHVTVVKNARQQITELSYHGQNGITAFRLLQEHSEVTYKTDSGGVYITSIDGIYARGSMHWKLFVNSKPTRNSASRFVTKTTEMITWKLQ